MKLELKHLAPYLPYGLKIQGQTHKEIAVLSCCTATSVNIEGRTFQYGMWADLFDIKPILRPLSDFENVAAKDLMVKFSTSIDVIQEVWRLIEEKDVDEIKFKAIQMMCENHIDFNNLIEKGLAIDINTLNK